MVLERTVRLTEVNDCDLSYGKTPQLNEHLKRWPQPLGHLASWGGGLLLAVAGVGIVTGTIEFFFCINLRRSMGLDTSFSFASLGFLGGSVWLFG